MTRTRGLPLLIRYNWRLLRLLLALPASEGFVALRLELSATLTSPVNWTGALDLSACTDGAGNFVHHDRRSGSCLPRRTSFVIIVTDSAAVRLLADANIEDKRVLVLDAGLFNHHMLDKGFWEWAEHVVKLRESSEGMY